MNHADRVIAEARKAVEDYRAFVVEHPEAPVFQRMLEGAYVAARDLPGWHGRQLVTPEVADVALTYARLRAAAETAKYTLEIYGVEGKKGA